MQFGTQSAVHPRQQPAGGREPLARFVPCAYRLLPTAYFSRRTARRRRR